MGLIKALFQCLQLKTFVSSQVSPDEVRRETPDAGGKKKVSHRKVEDNPQKVKTHQKVEDSPKKVKKNPQPVKENLPQPQQVRENLPQPQQVQENLLQPQRVEDNCQKVEDKAKVGVILFLERAEIIGDL